MVENARPGDQRGMVEMELEKEKHNERGEERGWRKDGETGTVSKLNTSLALPGGGMPVYVEGGKRDRV